MRKELTPEQIAYYQDIYMSIGGHPPQPANEQEAKLEAEVEALAKRLDLEKQQATFRQLGATKYEMKPTPVEDTLATFDIEPNPDDPNEKALAALKAYWASTKSDAEILTPKPEDSE